MTVRSIEVRKELGRIYKKHRGLRPSVVVREATNPESPLHDEFEWDDSSAATQFRLEQARHLIRRVGVIVDDIATPVYHVPAAVGRSEGAYLTAAALRAQPSLHERALTQAQSFLRAAQESVLELQRMEVAVSKSGTRRYGVAAKAIEKAQEVLSKPRTKSRETRKEPRV